MKKIGLLSDTHGYLDPKIFDHFEDRDELWHAGDIGDPMVADALEKFKPLRAVYGNIDDKTLQRRFPEDQIFCCEDVKVYITHIGGIPPKYNSRVKKTIIETAPQLFICGHSHILRVKRDPDLNNLLYANPGAAGNQGFHSIKTIVRFQINQDKIENMEVIELGKRGLIS